MGMSKEIMLESALPKVSIGMAVWNGERFLRKALESLSNQTYQNIEIIILDNLSTDSSSQICKEFVSRDSRVRYILDEKHHSVMDAHIKLAHLADGEFYMVACDDDWYEPTYISRTTELIFQDPPLGLVYSRMGLIDEEDNKSLGRLTELIKRSDPPIQNLKKYFKQRNPVPIIFGVVRRDIHLDAMKYYHQPDTRGWDHDNLYMMRLLSRTRVEGISDTLFYYRQQDRDLLNAKRNQLPQRSAFANYYNHVLHQWAVTKVAKEIISRSSFDSSEKFYLLVENFRAYLHYIRFRYLRESIKSSATWKKIRATFTRGG
jgi:glycosyltransferase involved in cell wall biosynthesis